MDSGVEDAWKLGGTYVENLAHSAKPLSRAAYLASYAAKKWTKETPDGRPPEFAQMSRRPGIGAVALDDLEAAVYRLSAVPRSIRISGKVFPLDRYMRTKLQERTGLIHEPTPETPPLTLDEAATKSRRNKKREKTASARATF